MTRISKKNLPAYLKDIYSWLYLNPYLYKLLNKDFVQNFLTLGYHRILAEEVRKEISPHSHILQVGLTFGSQITKTYSSIGMLGSYTIIDIVPQLLEYRQEKYKEQRINLIQADAAKTIKGEYDTIICYMLLHELPPYTRTSVLNNMMKALKPEGKIIFIDYHLPLSYNPLKYIIRAVNRLYQPFAETLWKKSIKELTPKAETCTWTQQTYFGGIYQKVVATKK